jgi:hypothetical protein
MCSLNGFNEVLRLVENMGENFKTTAADRRGCFLENTPRFMTENSGNGALCYKDRYGKIRMTVKASANSAYRKNVDVRICVFSGSEFDGDFAYTDKFGYIKSLKNGIDSLCSGPGETSKKYQDTIVYMHEVKLQDSDRSNLKKRWFDLLSSAFPNRMSRGTWLDLRHAVGKKPSNPPYGHSFEYIFGNGKEDNACHVIQVSYLPDFNSHTVTTVSTSIASDKILKNSGNSGINGEKIIQTLQTILE